MEFRIDTEDQDDGGEALPSLYRWLYGDEALERTTEVELREAAPEEGAMGGAWDVVNVVLTHATALANLALALAAWRQNHPSAPPLNAHANGTTVTVHTDDPEAVRRLLEALHSPDSGAEDDSGADSSADPGAEG
ncbi:hypothetical protein ACEYXF_06570 [Streptomyces asiaticus]|uniref:effector-associated constant component EACC1 n=1 Tax=Streptomyces asiaticus TaxID=114695 RepID=UPI0039BDAAB2